MGRKETPSSVIGRKEALTHGEKSVQRKIRMAKIPTAKNPTAKNPTVRKLQMTTKNITAHENIRCSKKCVVAVSNVVVSARTETYEKRTLKFCVLKFSKCHI